jgi:hypothetical protein
MLQAMTSLAFLSRTAGPPAWQILSREKDPVRPLCVRSERGGSRWACDSRRDPRPSGQGARPRLGQACRREGGTVAQDQRQTGSRPPPTVSAVRNAPLSAADDRL